MWNFPSVCFMSLQTPADCVATARRFKELVQCSHPQLMHFGEPPLMHYRVFERWDGSSWSDKADL